MENRGRLIVISGPSGVGKGSVVSKILSLDDSIVSSVSVTSRLPRRGERNGVDYRFVSLDEFKNRISRSEFLEYTVYCGNYYGTLRKTVDNYISRGLDVILEIDVDGAKQIDEHNCLKVFISPPSMECLKSRLALRGLDDPELIELRVDRAKFEIENSCMYDLVVVNDCVDSCASKILNEIHKRR